MSYYEQTDTDTILPSYSINDANKVLTVDNNGLFLQWLQQTSELPIQTGNANKLLTTNGTAPSWTNNITATTTTFNIGSTTGNGANLITLNQNGASNFNVYTTDYSTILTPTTNGNITITSTQNIFGVGVNPANGVYVLATTSTVSNERVYVSAPNNLTSWTQLSAPLTTYSSYRSAIFAAGVWAVVSNATGQRTLFYTTDATALTGWTQIAGTTGGWGSTRLINRLKFLNNQFVTIDNASRYKVSSDCITWTEIVVNATSYILNDIEYSPELQRYVISTNSGILYYNGNTLPTTGSNIFTHINITNGINSIAWSSKLGLFIGTSYTSTFNQINVSNDGINWGSYTASGTWATIRDIRWINDFGGFFMVTPQQATNNCAISRNGQSWTFIPLTFTTSGNSFVYNTISKVFLFSNTGSVQFKNVNSIFSSYLDPEATYSIFNSNLKLKDNIEYEPQIITTSTGNTHFTTQFFNRSVISFNTTNANANIYLQGISFNGRIGTKFKIVKAISVNYGVRIHPYEACRIVTPPASMLNYNITNSIYDLIPQNYYGSFELTRVNDETDGIYTGTWLVDNVNVYPLLGGNVNIGDFKVIKASDGSDIINISATENVLGGYTRIANISGTLGQLELRNNNNAYKFSSPSMITKSSSNTYQWKINLDADNRVLNFIETNSDIFELRQSLVKSYKNVELYQSNLITAPRVITNVSIPTIDSSPSYYIHLNNNASYEPVLTWGNALTYPIGTVWEVLVNQYVNNLSQRAYFKMGTSMWWSYVNGSQNFKTTNDFYAELNSLYKIIVLDWDTTAGNTGTFQIIRIG